MTGNRRANYNVGVALKILKYLIVHKQRSGFVCSMDKSQKEGREIERGTRDALVVSTDMLRRLTNCRFIIISIIIIIIIIIIYFYYTLIIIIFIPLVV